MKTSSYQIAGKLADDKAGTSRTQTIDGTRPTDGSVGAFRDKAISAAIIFALCSVNLSAATRIKADNSDPLNLASSWTAGIVPGGADIAQFDSTVSGTRNLSLGVDTAWSQINFVNPAGNITLNAGNTLTLSNNTPLLFGSGSADLTLACNVQFAGPAFTTIGSPAGRTLAFDGTLSGRDVTVTLGNSASTILLGNPNTIRIGSAVQINTAGLRLGIGASSIGGPMPSGPLGTNLFSWAASSGTTELFTYNGSQTLGNPFRLQSGPLNFNSANDLTFSDLVDLNNGNRVLNVISNGVLRFTGVISNAAGLTKIGPGTLELGGTNVAVFANGLSIYGGSVRMLADEILPATASSGTLHMTNTTEVLDLNGFHETVRGAAGLNGAGNWAGTLDNTAANTTSTLTLGDNFGYTLAGQVQNSGFNSKLALVKVGTGSLTLTNARTFSGGLTNASDSEIYINSTGAAGTGPITLASLRAELVYAGGGTGLWTNEIVLAAGMTPVISAVDGNTLEIAGVISGPGLLNRTNTPFQQGLLNLSGDNTFTGGLSLFGGSVMLSHPRAAGLGRLLIGNPVYTGGSIYLIPGINLSGTSALTNTVEVDRDFSIGGTNAIEFAGPLIWGTNSYQWSINVTNPSGLLVSGPMGGYGFNKTGVGLLTLNGVCSHNGPSTVSTGPLALGPTGAFTGSTTILVGGSATLDVSAVPNFAVKTNQAMRTDGGCKISGDVTIYGALTNLTTSAATFSNQLTLAAGSTTAITIYPVVQPRTNFVCRGGLTFGGNLLVTSFGAALKLGDAFKLFDFTGNPGTFDTLTLPALDSGLDWDISTLSSDGTIRVVLPNSSSPPQFSSPWLVNGTNLVMTVTGGSTNGQFRVLTQTNVAESIANWTVASTNTYDASGNGTITVLVDPAEPQRFFRIVQP